MLCTGKLGDRAMTLDSMRDLLPLPDSAVLPLTLEYQR
jgi:hypothetical protein